MERNHQKELAYLNERLMDQSRESEKHYYLNSENKVRFVQEIDALNYQINESRKRISDLTQENRLKTEEIAKLAAVIKVLSKEKDDLGLGILKM
jgi:peptidoglycan hydrolase CwlO-like protein